MLKGRDLRAGVLHFFLRCGRAEPRRRSVKTVAEREGFGAEIDGERVNRTPVEMLIAHGELSVGVEEATIAVGHCRERPPRLLLGFRPRRHG